MDVYLTSSNDSLLGPTLSNNDTLPDNKLLMLPSSETEVACFPEAMQLERSWTSLEKDRKDFVRDALSYHSPNAIVAFDALLEQYGVYGAVGNANTFAAGALSGVTHRASYFGEQIAQLKTQYSGRIR